MRERLIQLQRSNGWQDAEMARRLGIGRSTWTSIKNATIPLSERVQVRAVRAFPDLLSTLVTSVTVQPPETPQEAA